MVKMPDRRAEAIARITAVRDEVLAREAAKPQLKPKVAKPKVVSKLPTDEASVKKREQRRKWKQDWVARNPEKAKEMKAKERARYRAQVKARMEADPQYREQQLAHRRQWPCRQNRSGKQSLSVQPCQRITAHSQRITAHIQDTSMTDIDDNSILQKIQAGKVKMSRLMTFLNDIDLEQTALNAGDAWVLDDPYKNLITRGILEDIAERKAALQSDYKRAAISVWMYRIEAKRRGLL